MLDDLRVPATNYAGAAWDALGGAPDPIVDIVVGSASAVGVRQNGPDDVFTINYSGTPTVTNARASDIRAYLAFDVTDEDITDYELISACLVGMTDAAFSGLTQTVACPLNAASLQSGYTLHWHLEPF